MRTKLVTINIIEKLDTIFHKNLTHIVKHLGHITHLLFIEIVLIKNPNTTNVFESKNFNLTRHFLHIRTIHIIQKMPTDHLKFVEQKQHEEIFQQQVINAREFHIFKTKTLHTNHRTKNINLELIAQTVELQTDRPFETN